MQPAPRDRLWAPALWGLGVEVHDHVHVIAHHRIGMEVNGEEICARAAPAAVRPVGEPMTLTIDMSRMHLIDPQNDRVV